ncbi:MAG TPA: VOC family protein [Gemmatimonadaceae bacterium]|nr:VOC family protein [Gemmatimonadaceae bacterium]
MAKKPAIECDQVHPTLSANDLIAATEFYRDKLGFEVSFTYGDPPTFAGVNIGNVQMFLQKAAPSPSGASVFFMVGNADELFEYHRGNGVEIIEQPADRDYGIRDYGVRDLNGYALSFGHPLFNAGEPIMIERVDVPVRLEKRLAALLYDLAEYKHMSVSSCLEEILLHTNEPLGDGVASPHTKGQLRYIQELKKKHGIDYDSHGSYRFREK